MREPTYFVMAALLDGPLHGYAIIKRAEAARMAQSARIVTEADRGAAVRPVRSRRQVRPA